MSRRYIVVLKALVVVAPFAAAHAQREPAIASSDVLSQISMFSYEPGRESDLVFRPTPIAAMADGKATVEYEDGNARISAKVRDLPEPATLGPYTAYVLWALTPDGRASNQGVLVGPEGGKGEIDTQYPAPQFALIVTAEPHFAVTVPSTMIALYNVGEDVRGEETKVSTLQQRADYSNLRRIPIDDDTNPTLVQAQYAVALATAAGAAQFAPQELAVANQKLSAAQAGADGRKKERKAAEDSAREAVIAGEDARREAEAQSALAETAERERTAAQAQSAAAAAAGAAAATEAARADLLNRLNSVLPTRETDRGMVSEIGGVQFATGQATLNVPARETLSRFAGIVASYPDLMFNVEGHTDDTGSAQVNRELSLRRAIAVRDYLIGQGVPASRIDVDGFGPSRPIADNSTAEGRAANRRVEIVISGGPLAAATSRR